MKTLSPLLIVIILLLLLLWLWFRRRPHQHPGGIEASDAAIGLRPTEVMLPDVDGGQEDRVRRRTGETQELRRKVVHGPYRAIDDPGAPSEVHMERPS